MRHTSTSMLEKPYQILCTLVKKLNIENLQNILFTMTTTITKSTIVCSLSISSRFHKIKLFQRESQSAIYLNTPSKALSSQYDIVIHRFYTVLF